MAAIDSIVITSEGEKETHVKDLRQELGEFEKQRDRNRRVAIRNKGGLENWETTESSKSLIVLRVKGY